MNLIQTIIDSTTEIFSNMVMLGITAGLPFERKDEPFNDWISGIIYLEGKHKGSLAIHLPCQTATLVTGSYLDLEIEEIDDDACDAVGELANMLAGNLKSVLDPGGSDVQLSLPSLLFGEEYIVDRLPNTTKITVPFYLDDGDFLVELQLRTES
ncbi:MAG: chemotaxis protein CheX [Geopsychrobacter sp.]|nr:chemotaxis protein CheX [Geopsychrobacter sp.]